LCGTRKARRGCPAVGEQICSVCCGTKRLVQIHCPPDCTWLSSAREHPPAVVVRRQQRDLSLLLPFISDLTHRQSQLFLLMATFLVSYNPPEWQALIDDDVAEAMDAMAATLETAVRGVIYDHRPASLPAERLTTALKPLLAEAGKGIGSAFDREAAVVMRRLADAARELRPVEAGNRRILLELLARIVRRPESPDAAEPPGSERQDAIPRLILP
jgi:hypothetical protein